VPPVDQAVTVTVGDLASNAPPAATDMPPAAHFPASAGVTVGPNGTLSFSPATVDIAAGGTVTWSWAAGNTLLHNVTSGNALFASPTQTSGTFTHTFPSAGSFFYFCTVHGRNVMNGTINVH
jgi:plastocyanin